MLQRSINNKTDRYPYLSNIIKGLHSAAQKKVVSMRFRCLLSRLFGISLLLLSHVQLVFAQDVDVDFSDNYERILQIRVVSQDAGSKSTIGSGFQVSADGLIITNYHVVSEFVSSPEHYKIDYSTHDGNFGRLELLDFDIISDLALLRHSAATSDHFTLADRTPAKGEEAYALGNPGDWGIVLVAGPTNGLVEHSYEDRVLFSGSLNPGMSGGPSLNSVGEVIGVNVATAGSQLSFLVPIEKVKNLLSDHRHVKPASFDAEITAQIKKWQRSRIQELIDGPWASEEFSGRELFGEIRKDFQCWGDTNDTNKERVIEVVSKSCRAGDDIYIDANLDAGQIRFRFKNLKPVKLNKMQFARAQSLYMSSNNHSSYENSTNYTCATDFINGKNDESNNYHRVITCVRAYKKLTGLYDSLLMVLSSSGNEVFKSSLALSAVEKDQIQSINRRFVEKSL